MATSKGRRRRAKAKASAKRVTTASAPFTIVGIGASAGGLEALEQMLAAVPPKSGTAFVVVQHLDPTHESRLVELLQRVSPIPVVEAEHGMRVRPNHVYVIPRGKDLAVSRGLLHVTKPRAARGLRLPIDFLFESLATELGDRSIGVLLSGMGSDGTRGLHAIHDAGGGVFVQDPATAKFDAMPMSAIGAGIADVVAPARELAARIAAFGRTDHGATEKPSSGALEKVVELLHAETGHDFSLYKRSTLQRRVDRRMALHQHADIAKYIHFLKNNPREGELLFRELLIGVTAFFRDPSAWERLQRDVLPALVDACPAGRTIRAWVPACSTGEEAYSLAMLFREQLDHASKNVSFQIFASDLDSHAVAKARRGLYPASIAAEISPQRLARFFVEEEGGYRTTKEIRDLVIFASHNVLQDPPFTKLDLLACRNLLIYLTPELQHRLISLFHYSLLPGGVLFLGSAETVGTFTSSFEPIDAKARIYRRNAPGPSATSGGPDVASTFGVTLDRTAPAPAPTRAASTSRSSTQSAVEQLLLDRFAPAAVVTSSRGDVLYVSGKTGRYLELPAGKANWNVVAMARSGLRHALTRGFQSAKKKKQKKPVVLKDLRVRVGGASHEVTVSVEAIEEPAALRGTMLVVFSEGSGASRDDKTKPASAKKNLRQRDLERELREASAELGSLREEMQSSEEELRSANEELQSTNEELQSTNEELLTSKEEMQSMNEELQTLNNELQANVDELSRTSNDMKNLLDSTEIAILFLDGELNVRRFTPKAATIFKLIPGDIGRPIADLASDLDYPSLCDDARRVLRTLVFAESAVAARDGRNFSVRIMPYRTIDNRIDGLVITLMPLPPDAKRRQK